MKIGIDARWIFEEISGIGAYTVELLRGLSREDAANDYVLFFHDAALRDRTLRELGLEGHPRFVPTLLPYGIFSVAGQLRMPLALRRAGLDVFHSTNYMIPLLAFPRSRAGRIKCAVTVHDVIPLMFREQVRRSRKNRLFFLYARLMREVGTRAHAVITDSRASRADVIRHLGIPPAREADVRAVYCGVSPRFEPGTRSGALPKTLLYVGRADPYKNVTALVEAFALVRQRCPLPVRLRIAGPRDDRYPEAPQRAEALGVADAVTWTGYLPAADLVKAYQEADVLVHPSLYEGFGLPVLEAMACGTPVVCSDIGALREVAGHAAVFVAPADAPAMAREIVRLLTDASAAAELTRRGLRQASRFTWETTARETLRIYSEIRGPEAGGGP